ncbi:hypothetical protein V5799_030441 [Amblyomma americanum]|uniref:Secreted protein n=1 Tax=Amblyomma americanum TaxID=6943 RepID=A0AAQ4EN95_AMBAM
MTTIACLICMVLRYCSGNQAQHRRTGRRLPYSSAAAARQLRDGGVRYDNNDRGQPNVRSSSRKRDITRGIPQRRRVDARGGTHVEAAPADFRQRQARRTRRESNKPEIEIQQERQSLGHQGSTHASHATGREQDSRQTQKGTGHRQDRHHHRRCGQDHERGKRRGHHLPQHATEHHGRQYTERRQRGKVR